MSKRARDVETRVREGLMGFQDLSIYLLNVEATRAHWRKYLKRKEAMDVLERLRTMHPVMDREDIPGPSKKYLPESMKALLDGRSVWCVEWFYEGKHTVEASPQYASRYLGVPHPKISSRLADMVGFCKWDSAMKLWIESLWRPDNVIFCEGTAYHFDVAEKREQKVRMISHIYDFEHVVTVTVVT
jgi:hypothetical protein